MDDGGEPQKTVTARSFTARHIMNKPVLSIRVVAPSLATPWSSPQRHSTIYLMLLTSVNQSEVPATYINRMRPSLMPLALSTIGIYPPPASNSKTLYANQSMSYTFHPLYHSSMSV